MTDEESNTATCTEAGTMKQHEICALCGETITTTEIDTEPLGHLFWDLTYEWADDMSTVTAKHVCARDGCNETESETVKPTSIVLKKNSCETEGLIRYHTEFKNEAFEPQEIETKTEALGHDWGEWKETKAPTCSAAGEKQRVCNNDSNHEETEKVAIDPDAHDWGEWVVTKEATEMTDGEETRTCRNDSSHTETQAIPALEHKHDLSKVDAVAATCTKEGNIEYWICDKGANACNRCFADKNGKKEIDKEDTVIKATGHTPGVTVKENEVSATCKEDGSYDEVIYCTVCNEELSRETTHTAPLGHDWEDFAETVDGIHIHIKRVCRRDASHVIEYDEDEGGHAHDFSRVEKKDATCESSGIMAHVICQICGNRYTDMDAETELSERNVYIEPLGHDWGEWKETKAPTCSAAGEKQRVCKNDASHKDIGTLAIVPDAHEWGEWTQTKAPTCSAAGEKQRVCKNDSNHEETETLAIDPDAHDWGEWTVIREATETRKGEKIRICKNNTRSHIEMREIPVLGHEHKLTKVDAADATCTEDGNIEYWICDQGANACGGYFADKNGKKEINKEDTVIKATGHKPGSAVKENEVTATCEKDGSYDEVVYCTICKEELSRETKMVTALGHDWREWVVTKEATETEEGEETRTCKNDPSHTETRVIPMGLSYRNVSGDGNVWYKGSNETSDFAFKRSVDDASTITHFTGISVDGSDVDPSCYTKESGSVIIKLEPEYLETLELGKHTLTSRFDDWDGNASAEFTVAEQEAKGDDNGDAGTDGDDQSTNGARTGDETMVVLWEMFFGGSLLLLLILAMRRRMLRR